MQPLSLAINQTAECSKCRLWLGVKATTFWQRLSPVQLWVWHSWHSMEREGLR